MISDHNAVARFELATALMCLLGAVGLVALAYSSAGRAKRAAREDKRALYAQIEQRDARIAELERAQEGARFEAPEEGPAEDRGNPDG